MRTGEIAKVANVSEKTIRYYDRIGLLKPSKIEKNHYRTYSEYDLFKLQKILFFKQLGFSLDEIKTLVLKEEGLLESLNSQKELLTQKIETLTVQKDILTDLCKQAKTGSIHWRDVENLLSLTASEKLITSNYRDSSYLASRIALHELYSTNPVSWFAWLSSKIQLSGVNRILELGSGTGKLWNYFNPAVFRNREVFLTDKSPGMVESIRSRLGKTFNCLTAECESIPFKDDCFDMVIANHVLFYVNSLDRSLEEITRVLNRDGKLYATAYSENHMKEITDLCRLFDPEIVLANDNLARRFGKENGRSILNQYFQSVEMLEYVDSLRITDSAPLINYILSCHGNQNERLAYRVIEFKDFVNTEIKKQGFLKVTKEPVLFVCSGPKHKNI